MYIISWTKSLPCPLFQLGGHLPRQRVLRHHDGLPRLVNVVHRSSHLLRSSSSSRTSPACLPMTISLLILLSFRHWILSLVCLSFSYSLLVLAVRDRVSRSYTNLPIAVIHLQAHNRPYYRLRSRIGSRKSPQTLCFRHPTAPTPTRPGFHALRLEAGPKLFAYELRTTVETRRMKSSTSSSSVRHCDAVSPRLFTSQTNRRR
jgi:hypothetical protein